MKRVFLLSTAAIYAAKEKYTIYPFISTDNHIVSASSLKEALTKANVPYRPLPPLQEQAVYLWENQYTLLYRTDWSGHAFWLANLLTAMMYWDTCVPQRIVATIKKRDGNVLPIFVSFSPDYKEENTGDLTLHGVTPSVYRSIGASQCIDEILRYVSL